LTNDELVARVTHRLRASLAVIAGYSEIGFTRDDPALREEAKDAVAGAVVDLTDGVDDVMLALELAWDPPAVESAAIDLREAAEEAVRRRGGNRGVTVAAGDAVQAFGDHEAVVRALQALLRAAGDGPLVVTIGAGANQATASIEAVQIHVRDVVRQQIELHERESGDHTISLVATEAPAEVLADRARLAQVVGNLLSNAIKYSPAGGAVRVEIDVGPRAVRVSVSDEGIGIALDQQGRIFERFFRVDSSDTREIGGTGLGLALSRELVEAQGGKIGFASAPGEGSTFWFELAALDVTAAGRARPRVLVVGSASPLREYLEEDGFRVETTASGAEALRRLAADPPALVCLDIGLPGPVDGWELLAELKSRSETASTPVVVFSGSNGRRRASALGAADVLAPAERRAVEQVGVDPDVAGSGLRVVVANQVDRDAAGDDRPRERARVERVPNLVALGGRAAGEGVVASAGVGGSGEEEQSGGERGAECRAAGHTLCLVALRRAGVPRSAASAVATPRSGDNGGPAR
jgi:signal transduction histidine kinase/CheY-like chemotaxis protein